MRLFHKRKLWKILTLENSDVVIIAVPYLAVKETVERVGSSTFDGKTVVDVTNILGKNYEWAIGFSTSGAEELAKMLPEAKVVKSFNTVFAENMSEGNINGEILNLFVAADDGNAKKFVMKMWSDIGFEPVDAGDLKSARYLEAMGIFLINLGYGLKMGNVGFKVVKKS